VRRDRVQIALLVGAAAADRAALDLDRDLLRAFGGFLVQRVDAGFGEAHVDLLAGKGFVRGGVVELAQHAFGGAHRVPRAGDAEDVAAVGDLDAEAQLDLAQVLVERAGEVGKPTTVGRFEREIVVGEVRHRRRRLARSGRGRHRSPGPSQRCRPQPRRPVGSAKSGTPSSLRELENN
jgi:hypothetical protein